jgi:hypothetical protein
MRGLSPIDGSCDEIAAALAFLLLLQPAGPGAHRQQRFSVVQVHGPQLRGSIELAVRDVELAIGVDANHDGKVTWGELRAAAPQLAVRRPASVHRARRAAAVRSAFRRSKINERVDGSYAWLPFTAHCPLAVQKLSIATA